MRVVLLPLVRFHSWYKGKGTFPQTFHAASPPQCMFVSVDSVVLVIGCQHLKLLILLSVLIVYKE